MPSTSTHSCQHGDATNMSMPAACRCQRRPQRTPEPLPQPSDQSGSAACDLQAPASHAEAFDARLTAAFKPWQGSSSLSALSDGFSAMRPWCRVWACVIRGQLYVKGWRREGSDFKAELLSGNRHASFLLGLVGTLQRHKLPDVCALHSCLDMPLVRRPAPHASVPPLVLSFMSSDDHRDVPWPDYKHWGLPSTRTMVGVPPWGDVREAVLRAADARPYAARRGQLFANTAVGEDGVDKCAAAPRPPSLHTPTRGVTAPRHASA
jgi:hypothetical protein